MQTMLYDITQETTIGVSKIDFEAVILDLS